MIGIQLVFILLSSLVCPILGSNIGHFIQISDIHYDPNYQIGAPNNCMYGSGTDVKCCHVLDVPLEPFDNAKEYGDLKCNTPYRLIDITLEYIRDDIMADYDIDFMIWNGDSTVDTIPYSDGKVSDIDKVTQVIKEYLPVLKVFPVVGKSDVGRHPNNHQKMETTLSSIYALWEDWLPVRSYRTFVKRGYYVDEFGDIVVIVMNKMYYDMQIHYNNNTTNNTTDKTTNAHVRQLTNVIEDARDNNKSVWLIGHTYPHDSYHLQYSEYMYDLIDEYSDTITNQFWGSSHHNHYVLYDYDGITKAMGYVGSSILPDRHHPEFRVYSYDKKTMDIINYEQYALNITELNDGKDVKYEKIYDIKTEYGMKDLSVESWVNLTDRLESDIDIFDRWHSNYYYGTDPDYGEEWKRNYLCNMKYLDLYDNIKCRVQ
jgi:hypothetical protein